MNSPPAPPYKVEFLQPVRAEIKRCLRDAQRIGIAREVIATIRAVHRKLVATPHAWGEPIHHYRAAKLVLRKMIADRLLVVFAVHEERPLVFVKECRPIQGHPLESA
jgi:hypothetical protein